MDLALEFLNTETKIMSIKLERTLPMVFRNIVGAVFILLYKGEREKARLKLSTSAAQFGDFTESDRYSIALRYLEACEACDKEQLLSLQNTHKVGILCHSAIGSLVKKIDVSS